MSQKLLLRVPDANSQASLYSRYFEEEGVTEETVLNAVTLTYQRADVFNRDAVTVFSESGHFKAACGAGCGYCCHTLVSVLPPEAFHVADYLKKAFSESERTVLMARVRELDRDYRGLDGAERYAARASCPFLDDDTWNCRLHEGRPTVCRAMHSGSLPACMTAYNKRDPTVPAPSMKAFFQNRDATYAGMATALSRRGLVMRPVELNSALVTIWDEPDSMVRWLAGEDLFPPMIASCKP